MSTPVTVDIPHQLGREAARARIAGGVGRLGDWIPGGVADLKSGWTGDRMTLELTALGQAISGHVDVEDSIVRLEIQLPGMLGLFADTIREKLSKDGPKLLK
jgi:hypothetical protein